MTSWSAGFAGRTEEGDGRTVDEWVHSTEASTGRGRRGKEGRGNEAGKSSENFQRADRPTASRYGCRSLTNLHTQRGSWFPLQTMTWSRPTFQVSRPSYMYHPKMIWKYIVQVQQLSIETEHLQWHYGIHINVPVNSLSLICLFMLCFCCCQIDWVELSNWVPPMSTFSNITFNTQQAVRYVSITQTLKRVHIITAEISFIPSSLKIALLTAYRHVYAIAMNTWTVEKLDIIFYYI